MLSRFDTIPKRDRQTDRIAISISRVSIAVLTRDKNQHDQGVGHHVIWLHIHTPDITP